MIGDVKTFGGVLYSKPPAQVAAAFIVDSVVDGLAGLHAAWPLPIPRGQGAPSRGRR